MGGISVRESSIDKADLCSVFKMEKLIKSMASLLGASVLLCKLYCLLGLRVLGLCGVKTVLLVVLLLSGSISILLEVSILRSVVRIASSWAFVTANALGCPESYFWAGCFSKDESGLDSCRHSW